MDPFQDYCFSGFLGYIIFFLIFFFSLWHSKIAEGAVQSGLYLTGMTLVLWVSCCSSWVLSAATRCGFSEPDSSCSWSLVPQTRNGLCRGGSKWVLMYVAQWKPQLQPRNVSSSQPLTWHFTHEVLAAKKFKGFHQNVCWILFLALLFSNQCPLEDRAQ